MKYINISILLIFFGLTSLEHTLQWLLVLSVFFWFYGLYLKVPSKATGYFEVSYLFSLISAILIYGYY